MSKELRREKQLSDAVQAHRRRLSSMISSLLKDEMETEDVLQDVFEEFIASYDVGTTIEKLGSWLVTVARNKVFDRFRRRKTRADYAKQTGVTVESDAQAPSQPDEEWTRSWLRKEIAAALELLPPEQRQVFVLHELEGKSFEQIREETKVPLGTLLARKKYAVDFLRVYLKEIYDELG